MVTSEIEEPFYTMYKCLLIDHYLDHDPFSHIEKNSKKNSKRKIARERQRQTDRDRQTERQTTERETDIYI